MKSNKLVIHRNTNYIKFRAAMYTNACNRGDVLEAWKDCYGWHIYNTIDGKRYSGFADTIRAIAGDIIEQSNKQLSASWKLAH